MHHLKLCYFLMKKDNTMICGVLLNHCLTVNRIISKSVCLETRLRDTSLKRCGVKSQFTNSVHKRVCPSLALMQASTTTTHASSLSCSYQLPVMDTHDTEFVNWLLTPHLFKDVSRSLVSKHTDFDIILLTVKQWFNRTPQIIVLSFFINK